ncbi:putative lipase family protein [Phaeomoniella chlamydospora]|uniref:sn-1-specific diacylglycerol lipase n=1 Tax=Phaeomoniella chlamydospora TaxID=158046 RepID=A0A0G2EK83_PHACM|nr:putative lipase family protein [Phaeomoniella chlamydospora]
MPPAPDEEKALQKYDDETKQGPRPPPSRPLLPGFIAASITTFTGATSLGLRVGTKIGGWALGGAREATLGSLELSRAFAEAILFQAGRDVAGRRNGELGHAEAENILERSVSALHRAISTLSFTASAGFYMATVSMNAASDWSQHSLATLNAILGSTESSRAVAAILTLMRDEFRKPEPDEKGESAGYLDLFAGTVAFVLLQRWGRRKTDRLFIEAGGEEIIWDAVIDDKGFRADVVGTQLRRTEYFDGEHTDAQSRISRSVSFVSPGGDRPFEAVPRENGLATPTPRTLPLSLSAQAQSQLTDEEIRGHIMSQLPEGVHANVTSETISAKTIRVDIYDAEMTDIAAPPGTVLIAERFHHGAEGAEGNSGNLPHQTVVFQTSIKRTSSSELHPLDKLRLTASKEDAPESAVQDDAVSPTMSSPSDESAGEELFMSDASEVPSTVPTAEPNAPQKSSSRGPFTAPQPFGTVANQKRQRKPPVKEPIHSPIASSSRVLPKPKRIKPKSSASEPKIGNTLHKAFRKLSPTQSTTNVREEVAKGLKPSQKQTEVHQRSINRPVPTSGLPRLSSDMQRLSSPFDKSLPKLPHQQKNTTPKRGIGLGKTRSDKDIWSSTEPSGSPQSSKHHQRSRSFVPSLYSVATRDSDGGSLIIAPKSMPRKSVFEDQENVVSLMRDGKVPGIFPDNHLIKNVRRFVRFSSASYGKSFLRIMGLTDPVANLSSSAELKNGDIHHEHESFSQYTGLPTDTILLSSFVDPHGVVTPLMKSADAALPLVHFISIDHESRAVVLTCRGTLGFEDVLTDMMCDYDDLYWRGAPYKVHKGIHASARRLLAGTGSRVMLTLKAALEEYPDFGLVLCGHSLGGAVASLLAILISEPRTNESTSSLFATVSLQKLLSHPHSTDKSAAPVDLPAGRSIHVYAYGPPATMSSSLRIATRGLITTIVNGADIVPSLSLGLLYDFRSIAINLKTDTTDALSAIKVRVMDRIRHSISSHFHADQAPPPDTTAGDGVGEDAWAWAALKTLRAGMGGEKLLPPGEVFVVETTRVFDRSNSDGSGDYYPSLGRAATRVTLRYVRDVETRFGELRFGSRMFSDHSPARYEASLSALNRGILEDE